ncbi:hypothetical protein DOZ80_08220 [Pseudomonas fluorescens]|uniref:Uncharacterized protein n=1 Tax=Pseudomonas fluorescens TaxID=294 RepID=A0A327NGY1_PSEFL|nr:hypothetical protein DOZ80_08220 [Pseudomonas fluorescens]
MENAILSRRGICGEGTVPTPVGASSLAMVVNDYVCGLNKCGVLVFFATELAPTRVFTPACTNPEIVKLGPKMDT